MAEKLVNEDWILTFSFKAMNVISIDFDDTHPRMLLMGPNGSSMPMPKELEGLFGLGGNTGMRGLGKPEEGEGENEFKLDKNTKARVLTVILTSFNEQKSELSKKMLALTKELTVAE